MKIQKNIQVLFFFLTFFSFCLFTHSTVAHAATTYTVTQLNATVSGSNVTSTTTIKASATTTAQFAGVCARDANGNNFDFPKQSNSKITTTGTTITASETFTNGTYSYFGCLEVNNVWYAPGATQNFTVGSTIPTPTATPIPTATVAPTPTPTAIPNPTPTSAVTPTPTSVPSGPITQDSVGTVQQKSAVTSVTWNHTVGNFNNRILVVGVSVNGSKTVSSVKYGTQTLTKLDNVRYGTNTLDDELWYGVNPTIGTAAVSVTLSGSAKVVADSVSFYNVNQSTPFGIDAKASGKGTTATVNVPSGSNRVVIDLLASDTTNGNFQPASGQTSLWNGFTNTPESGASRKASFGTSTTMTWTDSKSDNWADIGVALLQASGGSSPTPTPTVIPSPTPTTSVTPTPTPTGSPSGVLAHWQNALTTRGAKGVTWLAIGDSITEGQGASQESNRWTDLTLNQLRSAYPTTGVTGGIGYLPGWYATFGPDSTWQPYTAASGSINWDSTDPSFGLRSLQMAQGSSETYTVTGTSVDLYYNATTTGGTFSYQIDSGTPITVSDKGNNPSSHVIIPFLVAGTHTVKISDTSGTDYVEGLMVYNGDENAGIRLVNAAHSGIASGDFQADRAGLNQLDQYIQPDLVTILLGANDYLNDTATPSQVKANIESEIANIYQLFPTNPPSIVVGVYYGLSWDSANSLGYTFAQYNAAIRTIPTDYPTVGLLDFSSMGNAIDGGLWSSDALHPSDAGHATMANITETYLTSNH